MDFWKQVSVTGRSFMENVRSTIFIHRFAAALLMALLSLVPLTSFAQQTHTFIGLSPSSDEVDSVLREIPITKTLNLQRDLDELDLFVEVTFRGEGAEYLTGEPTAYFPVGVKTIAYNFTIDATQAPMGTFDAVIEFLPADTSFEGEGTGLGVKRGVGHLLTFTVSDQELVSYMITGENFSLTEVGKPIVFSYSVNNDGNVNWRPDEIVIYAHEYVTEELFEEFRISLLENSPPGKITTHTMDIVHDLPPGTYTVVTEYYTGSELVRSANASLTVFEKGTLNQRGEALSLTTNKSTYAAGELIKIEVDFQNTGELRVTGRLVTEIYDASGSLIDLLTSDELTVDVGESVTFSDTAQIGGAGEYVLASHIEYGNKVTEVLEIPVSVEALTFATATRRPLMLIAVGVLIFAVLTFVGVALSKRKKKGGATAPAPQAPAPVSKPATPTSGVPATPPVAPQVQQPAPPVAQPTQPVPPPVAPKPVEVPVKPTPPPAPQAPAPVQKTVTPASAPQPPQPPLATPPQPPKTVPPSPPKAPPAVPPAPPEVPTEASNDDDMWTINL